MKAEEMIKGRWYKLTDCTNSYRKFKELKNKDYFIYSDAINNGEYYSHDFSEIC